MATGDNNSGGFVTRQVVTQRCAPEEVEPGRHVYRCERKIQTFRDCYGRPSEVISSQTETTDHEMDTNLNYNVKYSVTQSSSSSSLSSSSINWGTDVQYSATEEDNAPMMEGIERLDTFIEGVERMTEGIMAGVERIAEGAWSIADIFRVSSLLDGGKEEEQERDVDETDDDERVIMEREQDQVYSEYADKIRDV